MIVISGIPRSGKTTLSNSSRFSGLRIFHSDDLIDNNWSKQSDIAYQMIFDRKFDVMEGTTMVRALRKCINLKVYMPEEVIWMPNPKVTLSKDQASMANGCISIWNGILPYLQREGIKVEVIL